MHDRLVALTLDALKDQLARSEREAALARRLAALGQLCTMIARPLRVEPAPVDVAAVLWDAAGTAVGARAEAHVRLALEPGVGTIVTDAVRLRGVLANLVQNARDAVRAAGRSGGEDIEVGGRRHDGDRLLLWVEDRGAGVAAEDLPHVFEPFFTTKRAGTGLGLAIAHKVVDGLQGSIRMKSRKGEGTRVEIELPTALRVGPRE